MDLTDRSGFAGTVFILMNRFLIEPLIFAALW
jgi:hypothetical protein